LDLVRQTQYKLSEPDNLVIFFVNGLGDALMALPTLRAITEIFHGKVTLICQKDPEPSWFYELKLKKIFKIKTRIIKNGFTFQYKPLIDELVNCDIFISLVTWQSEALNSLINYINPKLTMGFFPNYDVYFPIKNTVNMFDQNFMNAQFFNQKLQLTTYATPPIIPENIMELCILLKKKLLPSKRLLAIQVETVINKMWPIQNFKIVINQFLEENQDYSIAVVGHKYFPLDQGIYQNRIIGFFGMPVEIGYAMVSLSDLFIGIDSCMLHAADLFNIPSIGLFGPTNEKRFGSRFCYHQHMLGYGNMKNIKVIDVLETLKKFVKKFRDNKL
jgi:hypothetical protein